MTYRDLVTALEQLQIPSKEGSWRNASPALEAYIVYAIDGRDDLIADGAHAEKMLEGAVHLFSRATRGNGLALVGMVESALDAAGVHWRVGLAADYEDNTGLTHWEWIFRCLP